MRKRTLRLVLLAVGAVAISLPPVASAAVPGRNGRIAFVRGVSGTDGLSEIWSVRSDGSDASRLTTGHRDAAPAYSPRGGRIAFMRDGDIWVMGALGGYPRRLVRAPRFLSLNSPTFSPGGSRIAFGDSVRLVSVRASDGRRRRVLYESPHGDVFGASWSRAGLIAFSEIDDCSAVCGARIVGLRARRPLRWRVVVPGSTEFTPVAPDWAPDGHRLVYARQSERGGSRIALKRLGHRPRRFTGGPSDYSPAWSPDGRLIAFVRRSGESVEPGRSVEPVIRIARLGHKSRPLVVGGEPDWQPLLRRRGR
jgi:Tol biopolymer transport system component